MNSAHPKVSEKDKDYLVLYWSLNNGYARATFDYKTVYLHRLILSDMLGRRLVRGEEVDHINGDRLDCRRENLRLATKAQNCQNSIKRTVGTSKYKGVCWHKGVEKWQVSIRINGELKYLGIYEDEEFAARVYDCAAHKYFGEFAGTNFEAPSNLESLVIA